METILKVLRLDEELDAPGHQLQIPLGWEFEEIKQAAFKLAYPGNGEAPWDSKLETSEGTEVDDVSLISVVPSSIIVVNPGENFVDAGIKTREKKVGTLSRLRGSLMKEKKDDKEDDKKDQKEREEEKERERERKKEEEKEREKEKEKEKETTKKEKRLSFFGSVRKTKAVDFDKDSHLPDWLRLQKRIFTRYLNQRFRSANSKTRVEDLAIDSKDGLVLIELLEIMSGKTFPDKKIKPQKVRIKQIDNCVSFLNFARDCGVTADCSAENIVDGEEKNLMSLIYAIIIKYMKLDEDNEESAGMDVKETLVMWLRNKLQGYDISVDEKNICKTFLDGMAFCALLHRLRPRLIPYKDLIREQKIKNLTLALDVAEQFAGVQQYVEPSDISKLDELGMIVYLLDWYHGIAFVELQNSCARRIGKLIRTTVLHDRMKAEFDERAQAFVSWVDYKIKQLDDHTFDNTLEGIRAKQTSFYSYKTQEKTQQVSEQMDIEALFEDLSLRLATNKRPAYNPPKGLSVLEIRAKMKDLEASENARALAMQKELARQNKLLKLANRFAADVALLNQWIANKTAYLQVKEEIQSIAAAQRQLNVLDSFNKEWNSVSKTNLASLKTLAADIVGDNFNNKASIVAQTSEVDNKFHNLTSLSEVKGDTLSKALELEKKKEQVRLEFASAAKDYQLYAVDQLEVLTSHYFGDSLEEVQAFPVSNLEQEISKALSERRIAYEALWAQIQQLKITENIYTSITPADLAEHTTKVEEAIKARRAAYNQELEKLQFNDDLSRKAAAKFVEFFEWISAKKAAVGDTSQELEQKLELVRSELAVTKSEGDAKIAEMEEDDAKLAAAEVTHNNYAKYSSSEAKTSLEQYVAFLEKLLVSLEAEYASRITKGVTEEQKREIVESFDYFDKDASGFLEWKEFRACLQALGLNFTPAHVREALATYDKDEDGKISRDEFSTFMLDRLGDTDSLEEILAAFQIINQKDYADLDHLNAVVHDVVFPEEYVAYLQQEMSPQEDQEGGYNYTKWTEEVFSR